MKKVLLVGDHPNGATGNSHMMSAILKCLDPKKHDITIFTGTSVGSPVKSDFLLFDGGANPYDEYGGDQLIRFIARFPIDVLCFIGLDIWRYAKIYLRLVELKKAQNFRWATLFPYDYNGLRREWIELLKPIDIPAVYSKYGYEILRKYIPNLFYFRPPLFEAEKFQILSNEIRQELRKKFFQDYVDENTLVFGFFGKNQFRKDPLRLIKAFFEAKKTVPNSALYLHTDMAGGVYNFENYINDCGGKIGDVLVKKQNYAYPTETLVEAYNAIDCLINTSLQEGLSWTVIEAMLCGVPVVVANTTSQQELIEGGAGIGVPSTELAYLPILAVNGAPTFIESRACNYSALVYAMKSMKDPKIRENLRERGLRKATNWLSGTSDFNEVLEKAYSYKPPSFVPIQKEKVDAVLFAQHSAAGDVFMTTRCLRDLKNRHPEKPLHYMTQKKYQNIIEGHPCVDEIKDWGDNLFNLYQITYNPHGDRILPGHWGRNSNSILSDFYWKVLMIDKPDDFYIGMKTPKEEIGLFIENTFFYGSPICVLHTTGGDPEFRTYKYMKDVVEGLRSKYFTIQVGGEKDFPALAELDLRGKLSYQETAWVVSHAKIAVTVDSFMSHLCGALGIPQVCLFGSGNHFVVRPLQVKGDLICMVPDYVKYCKGLGPCSASVRDCPVRCTGLHDPKTILENIKKLEENL